MTSAALYTILPLCEICPQLAIYLFSVLSSTFQRWRMMLHVGWSRSGKMVCCNAQTGFLWKTRSSWDAEDGSATLYTNLIEASLGKPWLGKRKRGRPWNSWWQDLEEDITRLNYTGRQLERGALDQDGWRVLSSDSCSRGDKKSWW